MKYKNIFILISALTLTACAGEPDINFVCPTIVSYSDRDKTALIAELTKNNDSPQVIRWLGDYIGLRDQVRVCRNRAM